MKKFFFTMGLGLLVICGLNAQERGTRVFDILAVTDFHGNLEDAAGRPVAAALAKNIKEAAAANPKRTLIIGGGDLYQGTPLSNVLRGVPVQKLFSGMGMAVTALGNHEFDWGLDTVRNVTMKGAAYSIVCANLYDRKTKQRAFEPYRVIVKDGVRIAVIGAITTETPSIVLADTIANYRVTDPVAEINMVAREIRQGKKADVVLVVIHEGGAMDAAGAGTGPLFDIVKGLKGVDAVIGGHSHTIVTAKVGAIPVVIANNAGKGYIDLRLTLDAKMVPSFSAAYVAIDNDNPNGYKAASPAVDPQAVALVDTAKKEIGPIFGEKLGTAAADLTRTQDVFPYGESFLGNWACDATRNKAKADVGIQNNGGIRIDVPKGDITVGTIFTVMPFDNTICVFHLNKAQLKGILEQAFNDEDKPNKLAAGKGIQVSGIKVLYDSTRPSFSRIVDIFRGDGGVISDDEILKVATNNFLATGGDGFTDFKKYKYVDSNLLVRDAMLDDVRQHKGIFAAMDNRIDNLSKIAIIGTADLHGAIFPYDYFSARPSERGLAKIAAYVKAVRAYNPRTVLVDAGDTIQGTPLSYYYNKIDTTSEHPLMKVMGAMRYDTWTLGNHEFNYGLATLNRVIADANKEGIAVLSANTYAGDGTDLAKPYMIKDFPVGAKTFRVGILGLTTKTIPSWENETNYQGLRFNDLADEAKKWVPLVREAGADVVIAVIHSGEEKPTDTIPENQVRAVAAGVSGIDAIICGHTHDLIAQDRIKNPDGRDVLITEPRNNGAYLSEIDLTLNGDGTLADIRTRTVAMDKYVAADPQILALAKPYQDATLAYVETVIGGAAGEFSGSDQATRPSALMDLINIIQMKAAGTQLSIAAPLSATAFIPKGNVTIKDISGVYIYENYLYGITMTGAQLKKWMEFSARYYKQVSSPVEPVTRDPALNIPDYNLDILYGATYDIDLTKSAGSRIVNLAYQGKPIRDDDTFTVAVNNYRFNGGGGFMAAAGLKPGDTGIVTYDSGKQLGDDGQVRNLMIQYIREQKTVSPTVAKNWKVSTSPVAAAQPMTLAAPPAAAEPASRERAETREPETRGRAPKEAA